MTAHRRHRRLGAYFGLALLALDLLLGVVLPLSAAQAGPISAADYAVCTIDGISVGQAGADGSVHHQGPVCSACLPLINLLPAPQAPALALLRVETVVTVSTPAAPPPGGRAVRPFRARAPPAFV